MLGKVLKAELHPHALIAVNDIGATDSAQRLRVTITLHGTARSVDAEARVEKTGEEVSVTGTFAIDLSRFGIAPFSILGGAIAIQDRVNINFRIHAYRVDQPARQPGAFM
jgi:polyisoprenoid-binding protein YceI